MREAFASQKQREFQEHDRSALKEAVNAKGIATGSQFFTGYRLTIMQEGYVLFKPLRTLWERMLPPLKYVTTRWILIPKLKSDSAEVRSYAAQALESMGDTQAVLPLIEALRDVDGTVRLFAIASLGALRDVRAVEPLIPFLNDPEADIRCATAVALGDLKASHSVEPLIAALNDPDRSVCSATVIALGKIGSQQAIEPLNELAKTTESEWLRRYVSETLHQIEEHEDKNDSYSEVLY